MRVIRTTIVLLTLIIVTAGIVFLRVKEKINQATTPLPTETIKKLPTIKINNTEIPVEIANTPEKQRQGLSGRSRDSFPENQGVLFVFNSMSQGAFWMIDMNFPIDIIWIAGEKIVYISADVPNPSPGTPSANLPLYRSPVNYNYVLEVNAGFAERNGIKVGDKVDLSQIQ